MAIGTGLSKFLPFKGMSPAKSHVAQFGTKAMSSTPAQLIEDHMHRIVELGHTVWSPALASEESRRLAGELELGKVLYLPRLGFTLMPDEKKFLDPHWLSGTHKSVSYEPVRAAATGGVRGA
jgi:hypothetical protein